MFKKWLRDDGGFIAPAVVIVFAIIAVIVVGVLIVQGVNSATADSQTKGIRAQYLAEYAAQAAIRKLMTDNTYRTNTNSLIGVTDTVTLDSGGKYSVMCNNPNPTTAPLNRVIQASGRVVALGVTVAERTLTLDDPPLTLIPPEATDNMGNYSFFSLGAFSLSGSAAVTGNVGTLSTTTLSGSTRINGSVAAASVNCPAWCTITGTRTAGYTSNMTAAMKPGTTSTITGLNRSTYSGYSEPPNYNSKTASNYTYSSAKTIPAGTYYCNGKLTSNGVGIISSSGGPVLIYCTGNVQIGNSGGLNGTFMIISEGTINVDGAAVVNKAVLISAGNFTDGGSGSVKGSVVSFGTSSVSGAGFVYDQAAFDGFPDIESQLAVTNPGWSGSPGSGDWTVEVGGYSGR